MIVASTLSTIEAVIPYLILSGVVLLIAVRLVVGPLVEHLRHARQREEEQTK